MKFGQLQLRDNRSDAVPSEEDEKSNEEEQKADEDDTSNDRLHHFRNRIRLRCDFECLDVDSIGSAVIGSNVFGSHFMLQSAKSGRTGRTNRCSVVDRALESGIFKCRTLSSTGGVDEIDAGVSNGEDAENNDGDDDDDEDDEDAV